MTNYRFQPNFGVAAEFPGFAEIADLEREQGVYSATPKFIRENCGDIAREILRSVPDDYYAKAEELKLYVNCDVRIHRLYPGDYPAYPGWHCDGEYRETYFSQPDLNRIPVSHHLIGTVSSNGMGVSNTQFLMEDFDFQSDEVDAGHGLWQQVNDQLSGSGARSTFDSSDGQLIRFDSWTLHRAMPARVRGWRLFFRMAMWHKPNLGDGGKVTKQEQVYKIVGQAGW